MPETLLSPEPCTPNLAVYCHAVAFSKPAEAGEKRHPAQRAARRFAWQAGQRSRRRRNERSECCMEASAVRKLTGIDALSTPLNASLPMFSMIYALSPAVSHHGLKPCGSRMGPSAVRKLTGIGLQTHRLSNTGS